MNVRDAKDAFLDYLRVQRLSLPGHPGRRWLQCWPSIVMFARNFINALPAEPIAISVLLDLLAPPTRRVASSYYYESTRGAGGQACLYLEADINGKLASWGIN